MSEESEAKRDGARLQKNSGRGQFSKGDAIWKGHLVDYKEYEKSFSVSRDVWAKICTDTMTVDVDLQPVIKLVLGSGNQKTRIGIVDWYWLQELVEHYERTK